MDYYITTKH